MANLEHIRNSAPYIPHAYGRLLFRNIVEGYRHNYFESRAKNI